MNTTSRLVIALATIILAPAALACDYPAEPEIPDGATASKDEMITASRAVRDFQAALETYRACIDAAETDAVAALEDPTDDELRNRQEVLNKRYNATVEQEQRVVALFNASVQAYRANEE